MRTANRAHADTLQDVTLSAMSDDCRAAPDPAPPRVGRYEIGEALGAGAMGVVYRARDPELDRPIAIKLVRAGRASRTRGLRLLREAQAMARLRHPNVVPIFDVGLTDNAVFVAMPLLEGGTLRSWLCGGPRSLDAILDRFAAAGRGLAAAHAAGLVHRDFKPDNVLLGADGEVQVADFGLARITDRERAARARTAWSSADLSTQTGAVLGTPAYMAPEQLRGMASDARADQFSFCVALWEAVHGERPFAGPGPRAPDPLGARLDAIAAGPSAPPLRRDRPAWIVPLLARGLAADPDRRWPTLQALLDAIAAHRAPRRLPWRVAAGLGIAGAATAIVAAARPMSAPAPRVLPAAPLVHLADLKAAAISPDGTRFAFVTGDALVIQDRAGATDRVVIEHGVGDPVAWSPDNRHVLVGLVPALAPVHETALVDTDTGARSALPVPGRAAFLSTTQAVVASIRQRSVAIVGLGERATVSARCDVPGDYTFLWNAAGLPDGTIGVEIETVHRGSHGLVILDRACRATAFSAEPIASFALSDAGTFVALVSHDSFNEIIEISPAGDIVSRRRTVAAVGRLIGRRHGVDYVTTLAARSELVRVGDGAARPLLSIGGDASLYPSPDGTAVVWITHDGRPQGPGRLWLALLPNPARSRVMLDDALTAGWSPTGRMLAVLAERSTRPAPGRRSTARPPRSLVVLGPGGGVLQRIALSDADPRAAPVWLDDRRIAIRIDDRTRYRWYDRYTLEHGEIGDRRTGSTLWLTRSPRDGTLAMWRMGPPDAIDARTEHLWLQPPGGAPRPLHVDDAVRHFLVPSWSSSGELVVRALETGMVSRVALDTGELTAIAQLPETPFGQLFDDHLVTLPGGDLLAVNHELGADVATVGPDDEPAPAPAREPDPDRR